jgi:hypothetical protein
MDLKEIESRFAKLEELIGGISTKFDSIIASKTDEKPEFNPHIETIKGFLSKLNPELKLDSFTDEEIMVTSKLLLQKKINVEPEKKKVTFDIKNDSNTSDLTKKYPSWLLGTVDGGKK